MVNDGGPVFLILVIVGVALSIMTVLVIVLCWLLRNRKTNKVVMSPEPTAPTERGIITAEKTIEKHIEMNGTAEKNDPGTRLNSLADLPEN